jgi:hypothetical protein
MPEPAGLPPVLSEPATAAVRSLNTNPTAATYLAIAISAVRARDEEVRIALRVILTRTPEAEAHMAIERLAAMLYGPAWREGI